MTEAEYVVAWLREHTKMLGEVRDTIRDVGFMLLCIAIVLMTTCSRVGG